MRPDNDEYFLMIAKLVSTRGTCVRRKVGCVLVDEHNHILATGYNGVPAGFSHCDGGFPCSGAHAPSGTNLDECLAVHAEQNALLQCRDMHAIKTCYITNSPCITCTKLLLNTSCRRIVFTTPYADSKGAPLWTADGRVWESYASLYRDCNPLRQFEKVMDGMFSAGYNRGQTTSPS